MAKQVPSKPINGARSVPAPKAPMEGPRTGGHTSNNGNGKPGC